MRRHAQVFHAPAFLYAVAFFYPCNCTVTIGTIFFQIIFAKHPLKTPFPWLLCRRDFSYSKRFKYSRPCAYICHDENLMKFSSLTVNFSVFRGYIVEALDKEPNQATSSEVKRMSSTEQVNAINSASDAFPF